MKKLFLFLLLLVAWAPVFSQDGPKLLKNGKFTVGSNPTEYSVIKVVGNGDVLISPQGRYWGVANSTGRVALDPKYLRIFVISSENHLYFFTNEDKILDLVYYPGNVMSDEKGGVLLKNRILIPAENNSLIYADTNFVIEEREQVKNNKCKTYLYLKNQNWQKMGPFYTLFDYDDTYFFAETCEEGRQLVDKKTGESIELQRASNEELFELEAFGELDTLQLEGRFLLYRGDTIFDEEGIYSEETISVLFPSWLKTKYHYPIIKNKQNNFIENGAIYGIAISGQIGGYDDWWKYKPDSSGYSSEGGFGGSITDDEEVHFAFYTNHTEYLPLLFSIPIEDFQRINYEVGEKENELYESVKSNLDPYELDCDTIVVFDQDNRYLLFRTGGLQGVIDATTESVIAVDSCRSMVPITTAQKSIPIYFLLNKEYLFDENINQYRVFATKEIASLILSEDYGYLQGSWEFKTGKGILSDVIHSKSFDIEGNEFHETIFQDEKEINLHKFGKVFGNKRWGRLGQLYLVVSPDSGGNEINWFCHAQVVEHVYSREKFLVTVSLISIEENGDQIYKINVGEDATFYYTKK